MLPITPPIEESWKEQLSDEFEKPYFTTLKEFLTQERRQFRVYPLEKDIFRAFNHTSFEEVKVVILGQDPYHGEGQAHGLSFSVPRGIAPPPSLKNIFKELQSDLGLPIPSHGDLTKWATQGVLLLNATLTVRAKQAGSHQKKGWEEFTDVVIHKISAGKEGVIFLLWGRYAQAKGALIDDTKHHILQAPHPSPFSAHSGFYGCKHFHQTNNLLRKMRMTPIDWQVD